jgi:hypothetical protein
MSLLRSPGPVDGAFCDWRLRRIRFWKNDGRQEDHHGSGGPVGHAALHGLFLQGEEDT